MSDELLEQPVNLVLKQYELLEITGFQETCTINMVNTMPWRMNLCAASQVDTSTFYVAMDRFIYVYKRNHLPGSLGQAIKKIDSRGSRPSEESQVGYTINAIKVAQLLDKEVLVTVAENGHVGVWITEDLDKEPLVLRHEDVSTWGLAIHKDGLVAVSTNNKIVTVFNILELTKTSRMFENDPDSKRKRRKRNALKDKKVVNLVGHEHNIPNIDFSHSGRYIASCSIDRTCRVWDLTKEKVVTQRKTALSSQESDSWGWCVKFISKGDFKYTVCDNEAICQTIRKKLSKGRSIHLSSLGMRHSAALPVYRFNSASLEADIEEYRSEFNEIGSEMEAWGQDLMLDTFVSDDEAPLGDSDFGMEYDPDDPYNNYGGDQPDYSEANIDAQNNSPGTSVQQGHELWLETMLEPDEEEFDMHATDGHYAAEQAWLDSRVEQRDNDDEHYDMQLSDAYDHVEHGWEDSRFEQGDDENFMDGSNDLEAQTWPAALGTLDEDPMQSPDLDRVYDSRSHLWLNPRSLTDEETTWPEFPEIPDDPSWPESLEIPDDYDGRSWPVNDEAQNDEEDWPDSAEPSYEGDFESRQLDSTIWNPEINHDMLELDSRSDESRSSHPNDDRLRSGQIQSQVQGVDGTDQSREANNRPSGNLEGAQQPHSDEAHLPGSSNQVFPNVSGGNRLSTAQSTQNREDNAGNSARRINRGIHEPGRLFRRWQELAQQAEVENRRNTANNNNNNNNNNNSGVAEDGWQNDSLDSDNAWNEQPTGIFVPTDPLVIRLLQQRMGLPNLQRQRRRGFLDVPEGSWDDVISPSAQQQPNQEEESESESEDEASSDEVVSSGRRIPRVVHLKTDPKIPNAGAEISEQKKGEKKKKREVGEYLVFTTAKDVYLLNTTRPRITTIRVEHEAISKIDVRSDRMLLTMDRINMVEWIPELELLVAASQKGTVALTRVLQVELDDGRQTCLFNNECYLPLGGLQPTPLYGMTVQRIARDNLSPPIFYIYLFYYDGAVLGYKLSRNKTEVDVNSFIV